MAARMIKTRKIKIIFFIKVYPERSEGYRYRDLNPGYLDENQAS